MTFIKLIFVLLLLIPVAFFMLYLINKATNDIPKDGIEDFAFDGSRRSRKKSSKRVRRESREKKTSSQSQERTVRRERPSEPGNWSSRLSNRSGIEPPLSAQRKNKQ